MIKEPLSVEKQRDLQRKVGKRLATYRRNQSLTQAEMAERYEITRGRLNHYETGRRPLNLYLAMQIAIRENLSLDALFLGIPRKRKDHQLEFDPDIEDDDT